MTEEIREHDAVITLVESDRALVHQPITHDGMRFPTRGPVGLCHLHQVRIRWDFARRGAPNLLLMLELYKSERVTEEGWVPETLDRPFRAFAKDGRFDLKGHGTVKAVTADTGHALWPEHYRLLPTLPESSWDNPEAAKEHLQTAVRMAKEQRKRIELDWEPLRAAMSGDELIKLEVYAHRHFSATFYQSRETSEGRELWVGRPPSRLDRLKIEKGMVEVPEHENAVMVCLSSEFMRNLKLVVQEISLKHLEELADAYWGKS